MAAVDIVIEEISPEDSLRAQFYALLAHFLARPPKQEALDAAVAMTGGDSELGQAVGAFSTIAAKSDPAHISQEYHDLFIGVARGELLPYGSYYLTGFLHEKPLARLREDMGRIGIERRDKVAEPEDHIAAVLEMMSGLIAGAFGAPAGLDEQKQFFDAHLGAWGGHFFADLEAAKSSVLYAAIGTMGRLFLDIEKTAFAMD